MRKIDVLIADDHQLIREALTLHVSSLPYVKRVRQATNGKEVISLSKSEVPDVVLMDIQMPEMDGIECSSLLIRNYPDIKIVALTAIENPKAIINMLELGVQGYCLKNMDLDELDRAIVSVVEKDFYQNKLVVNVMRHEILSNKYEVSPQYRVTERERKILRLTCEEHTSREIADEVFLSARTVEKIRTDLAKKLGVKGIIGLVRFAIKNGYDI